MWYLLAATLGSSLLVIILKMVKMRGLDATVAITVNYIVAAAISLLLSHNVSVDYALHAPWFTVSMVLGAMFMLSLAVYAVSADRSGVAITTISGRAAMAIPVVFAFLALGEKPTALKISLLVALLLAMWLILKPSGKTEKTKGAVGGWWAVAALPLAVFLFNGANDTVMQFASKTYLPNDGSENMLFNASMFVSSALTGFLFYIFENKGRVPRPSMRSVGWGVLLGVVNAVCCTGILYALGIMDGSVFYPLYYAGAVVISTVVGVWLFKERLSAINYIGIAIALTAIVWLASV